MVYYAGHGIEVDGGNDLIPVDARLERDTDIYDEGLLLDRILIAIEPAKKLRLVGPRRLPRQSVFQDHEADSGFGG